MFATLLGPYPARPEVAIADQIAAGIGLLADGKPAAEIVPRGVRGSEGRRAWQEAVRAVVVRWQAADAMARQTAARSSLQPRPVKACLVVPLTSLGDRHLPSARRPSAVREAAASLRAAIEALAQAGAPVIQLEADGLAGPPPQDADGTRRTLDLLGQALAGPPAGVHLSLSVAGGAVHVEFGRSLGGLPIASLAVDLCAGPDNWYAAAALPPDRGLIAGVADARTASPDGLEVLVWGARYAASLGGRGPERVGLSTSIGLEGLSRRQARAKLASLAEAARVAELTDPDELKRSLDPRAVDARSAALGRYQPGHQRDVPISRLAREQTDG
jgi:methionine synthase II (cobalamin-independent)